jgi:trk system potassium uptake protein TrkA
MLHVVVVGCGYLGTYLVERMTAGGVAVTAIDQDEKALSAIQSSASLARLVGDPMTRDVMERAEAHGADLVIAATPKDDLNVVIGVVATRLHHVKHAIGRVRDPKRADSFAHLGVETVCPTTLEAALVTRRAQAIASPEGRRIVIVGCGQLGSHVARQLESEGDHVAIVDSEPASFESLTQAFRGRRIEGDATDPSVLDRAEASKADLLVVATRNDVVNLVVVAAATQMLGVTSIITRVQDTRREVLFKGTTTLNSTIVTASAILTMMGRLDATEPSS